MPAFCQNCSLRNAKQGKLKNRCQVKGKKILPQACSWLDKTAMADNIPFAVQAR